MAFNLKNRSFLKEMDFTPRELGYLLQLSEAPQKTPPFCSLELTDLEVW